MADRRTGERQGSSVSSPFGGIEPLPVDPLERARALSRERARRYRARHKEQRQAYHREYFQRPQVKAQKAASWQSYYTRNRGRLLAYQAHYQRQKARVLGMLDRTVPLIQTLQRYRRIPRTGPQALPSPPPNPAAESPPGTPGALLGLDREPQGDRSLSSSLELFDPQTLARSRLDVAEDGSRCSRMMDATGNVPGALPSAACLDRAALDR